MSPPLIGLPGRSKIGKQITGMPEALADTQMELYFSDYSRAVIAAGGLPVHLPLDADPAALVARLDGVLLPGGTDIDPTRFGEEAHAENLDAEPERDEFELEVFAAALDRGVPVLGICRGMQIINVHQGGTLHQHVPAHSRWDLPVDAETHSVTFRTGSQLHRLYGDRHEVNSLHHQAIADVGRGVEVTASADDGGIEGLEIGDQVVAVQWHPEMMTSLLSDPLFRWLVDRASA